MIFLDANIIIYAAKPHFDGLRQLLFAENEELACSEMVRLEVFGYHRITYAEELKLKTFFQELTIFPIDAKIVDAAITLRKQRPIDSADALIAATALTSNRQLWTTNEQDFSWIDTLKWYNPLRSLA